MKARPLRRLHPAAGLTLCLLALAAIPRGSKVDAQWQPPCVMPPWSDRFLPWDRGSRVKVVIDASFTAAAASAITRAFGNWNAARNIDDNCSDVLFLIEPSPSDLPENTYFGDVPKGHVYVIQDPSPPVGTLLNPSTGGAVTSALITLDDCLTNNDSITGVTAHEIGHTFALENCEGCPPWSSILAPAHRGADGDDCNASYGGLGGPRECDNRRLSRDYYCQVAATPTPTPPPQNPEECQATGWYWNFSGSYCQSEPWYCDNDPEDCDFGVWSFIECRCTSTGPSPVVIDTSGDGFNLTSAGNGVAFDLDSDGTPERLSWTRADTDDAWLSLDRNGNGTVDNGAELFGNFTPQPDPPPGEEKQGFLALAVYDTAAGGGNGDGKINRQDSIFVSLRLWRDSNHDGVSQSFELETLKNLGLKSIDLDYKKSKRVDEHGNEFRYRAKVRDKNDAQLGRWAWDVFLVLGQ